MSYDYVAEDWYERRDGLMYDIYHKMLNRDISKIRLMRINPSMYKTALLDFMKFGKVTRYPTKYIDQWKGIIIDNTIMLDVITELYGHTNYFDVDGFNDYFLNTDETGNEIKDWGDAWEYIEENGYDEILEKILPKFNNGHDLISDYGLEPLQKICIELMNTDDHSKILVLINRALDISHQRSDLSELFIEGGSGSLDKISNLSESLMNHTKIKNIVLEYLFENKSYDKLFSKIQKDIDNLPSKDIGKLSDGYHTFIELYEFRKAYNVALFNEWALSNKYSVHKSWKHNDGEKCFGGGWFIVVALLPNGQISNHYESKDWDLFKIPIEEKALFEFDGHTSQDVIDRLVNL